MATLYKKRREWIKYTTVPTLNDVLVTSETGEVRIGDGSALWKALTPLRLPGRTGAEALGGATSESVVAKPMTYLIPVSAVATTDVATGDGQALFVVPESCNGLNLTGVHSFVGTAGVTGSTTIQVRNATDAVDMLSTRPVIDTAETSSRTGTAAVIDRSKDDVATGDRLFIDVDAVQSGTAPKGLHVELTFG